LVYFSVLFRLSLSVNWLWRPPPK